jgi:hypothetical protein
MRKYLVMLVVLVALVGTTIAFADNNGNHNGQVGCTLTLGSEQDTPGQMFQYLRGRPTGATGNPKAIVDAYPDSFDNVGDLIDQKCGTTD